MALRGLPAAAAAIPVRLKMLQRASISALYLKEPLGRNHAIGFALIAAGAAFVFSGRA